MKNGFDVLRRQVPVRYSVRGGKVIASTQPAQRPPYIWSSFRSHRLQTVIGWAVC
ncbi:hypothetical protein ACLK18_01980 [Escherichia coli]